MPTARTGTLLPGPSHLLSKDGSASGTQRGAHRAGCCGALGAWGEKKAAVRIQTWLPRGDKLVTLRGTCPWGGVAGRHPWVLPSILGAAGRSRGRAEGPQITLLASDYLGAVCCKTRRVGTSGTAKQHMKSPCLQDPSWGRGSQPRGPHSSCKTRALFSVPKPSAPTQGGQDPSEAATFAWKFPQYLVRKPALSHWKHWPVWCSSAMLGF